MSKYTNQELILLVDDLRTMPYESEWLEFKIGLAAEERIAKYISGLSNSACIAHRDYGYLIWGIDDKTHNIVGTSFNPETKKINNQPLRLWLKGVLQPEIGFEFFEVKISNKRVVILEIESAYRQPITYRKIPWIRFGSSLTELFNYPNLASIIYRTIGRDWSAELVLQANIDCLDEKALSFARTQFSEKHKNASFADEISSWDTLTFLNKAKLAIEGKLTKAAILLLGKPESSQYLSPAISKITWNLVDATGCSLDYHHFEPPFLLAIDQLYAKIRNITLRVMPNDTLFPVEISQYDSWVFREALHNSIAHQDYSLCCNIVVTEYPDYIKIANAGAFHLGTIENVLYNNGRSRYYANKQLVEAMVELKMIDTIGSGIQRMFITQQKRFMPLPEYDISPNETSVVLHGKVLNVRYTTLLMQHVNLPLEDIILLDKIQKGKKIDKTSADTLRRKKLIEGRYPNIFPVVAIANQTQQLETYLDNKAYDDSFYMQKILEYICAKGTATRAEIVSLLKKHLSPLLTDEQKDKKIGNLLSLKLNARKGWIQNVGSKRKPLWTLTQEGLIACRQNNPKCKNKCKIKML